MKRVLLSITLCVVIGSIVGVLFTTAQNNSTPALGDPTNPYYQRVEPSYLEVVKARIALNAPEYAKIRKTVMDKQDLQILEIWLSEGAMYAIFDKMPITSWAQLEQIKYRAKPTSDPRRAVSNSVALELMFLFDLPMGTPDGSWPWS